MVDRSLEIAGRVTGREVFVDSWAVEKIVKVGEAIAQARGAVGMDGQEAQVEAWRNLVKVASWIAGNTSAYDEELARAVFEEGEAAMLQHLEALLAPILRGG